ncbi:hypothetical protein Bbelb_166900 [Branchiostoma belcheri]|nr:hypothetical protein Bbelb_166900 [Branchiostoma belcheri]
MTPSDRRVINLVNRVDCLLNVDYSWITFTLEETLQPRAERGGVGVAGPYLFAPVFVTAAESTPSSHLAASCGRFHLRMAHHKLELSAMASASASEAAGKSIRIRVRTHDKPGHQFKTPTL